MKKVKKGTIEILGISGTVEHESQDSDDSEDEDYRSYKYKFKGKMKKGFMRYSIGSGEKCNIRIEDEDIEIPEVAGWLIFDISCGWVVVASEEGAKDPNGIVILFK